MEGSGEDEAGVCGDAVQGGNRARTVRDSKVLQPDHTKSSFLDFIDTANYIVHRIGPDKSFEKLYGPYRDRNHAQSKLSEMVEGFVREHELNNPLIDIKNGAYTKIVLEDFLSFKAKNVTFFYIVKPLQY